MSRPKRGSHEQQPQLRQRNGGQCQVSSAQGPTMRVGNAERRPLDRVDQREAVVMTGQWREQDQRYHLFINQAGRHLEMVLAVVGHGSISPPSDEQRAKGGLWALPDGRRLHPRFLRLGGDRDASDERHYHLFVRVAGDPIDKCDRSCGWLRRSENGKYYELKLELGALGFNEELAASLARVAHSKGMRLGSRPNLFDNYLSRPWVPVEVRTALWFPITPRQREALPKFIFAARVEARAKNYLLGKWEDSREFGYVELVERYFNLGDEGLGAGPLRQRRKNIAAALDRLVYVAYIDALTARVSAGGIDSFQRDHWREATLQALKTYRIEFVAGSPRSLLTHTHHILNESAGEGGDRFREVLGFEWKIDGGRRYDAELTLVDVIGAGKDGRKLLDHVGKKLGRKLGKRLLRRLPLGGAVGELIVQNKQDLPFKASYVVMLGGLEKSASGSAGGDAKVISSKGVAEHVYGPAWKPENLPGTAAFFDASAFASKGKGVSAGFSTLTCFGSGKGRPGTPLVLNFSGTGDLFTAGGGAGFGASGFLGMIYRVASEGGDALLDLPGADSKPEYGGNIDGPALHFPINGAMFLPEGERLLEIFAACELMILGQPGVTLEFHGYADQPHGSLENQILSRNRAMSTYVYLKNILEGDLAGPDQLEEIPPESQDMKEARKKTLDALGRYQIADPSSGPITIVAYGEEKKGEGKFEIYDQSSRRVEVFVDGEVRLRLARTTRDD